jgi:GNAT superfamily N-acetyltransferase
MGKWTELGIKSYRQVKYLSEVAPLISPIAKRNENSYPVVLQHLLIKGEAVTLRAEKQPTNDAGVTLAILNSEGLMIAQASNEWGATLVMVAREYRGAGLGKILLKVWWEHNPSFESGGYTQAGPETALSTWRDRVHEFSSRGWYSALVQDGRLPVQKVKQILSEAGEHPQHALAKPSEPEPMKATGDVLVYADEDGISFVVYDRAFLTEQDEKFIHGYGFFRDDEHVGVFIHTIEYDRAFADLTMRVALQMAKDNGEDLYDGEGYHDMMEIDHIPGIIREGDMIKVTQNLLPLKMLAGKEKRLRKPVDPYGEKLDLLLEMSDSKWK